MTRHYNGNTACVEYERANRIVAYYAVLGYSQISKMWFDSKLTEVPGSIPGWPLLFTFIFSTLTRRLSILRFKQRGHDSSSPKIHSSSLLHWPSNERYVWYVQVMH